MKLGHFQGEFAGILAKFDVYQTKHTGKKMSPAIIPSRKNCGY